ncbi:hypothetical protein K456DRAFT_1725238 [Colletotrichum gloeosporioides 23]|nr:hypothetical protein K456DRAFT_1725238 [Colletotrichum gloeosporioides 23]
MSETAAPKTWAERERYIGAGFDITQHKVTMRAVYTLITLLAATVAARFDGPCVDVECGTARTNCEADGMICVPFPSVDLEKRKGCTCSIG